MTDVIEDPRARARLAQIKAELRAGEHRAAVELWRRGDLLLEVQREALWRVDGAESFQAWVADELDLEPTQAWRAIQIATHFTEAMADRFGARKLVATLNYLQATKRDEAPGDALALEIRVRQPNGRFKAVPFAKASARQIESATADLRAAARTRDETERARALPANVGARAATLQAALPRPARGAGPKVQVKARKDGTVLLDLRALPVSGLREAGQALIAFAEGLDGADE
jgi:hypothetical protein